MSSETLENAENSYDEKFSTAVFIVQNLPKDGPVKTSNDEKLNFYGLFKQATHGPCDVPKPSFYDVQGVYKWNSWNKLDKLSKEEAKKKYVESIIDKIRTVQSTYKTEEWMKGDTYEVLAPKFEILGILEKSDKGSDKDGDKEVIKELDTVEVPREVLSDNDEYADAMDYDVQSRSSSFTEARHSRRQSPSLKNTCERLEKELQTITESIDKLGKAVEERHNLLNSLMKKATVYILVPRGTSWLEGNYVNLADLRNQSPAVAAPPHAGDTYMNLANIPPPPPPPPPATPPPQLSPAIRRPTRSPGHGATPRGMSPNRHRRPTQSPGYGPVTPPALSPRHRPSHTPKKAPEATVSQIAPTPVAPKKQHKPEYSGVATVVDHPLARTPTTTPTTKSPSKNSRRQVNSEMEEKTENGSNSDEEKHNKSVKRAGCIRCTSVICFIIFMIIFTLHALFVASSIHLLEFEFIENLLIAMG